MSNVPKPNPNRNYPYLSIEKVSLNEYIRSMKQYGHTEFLDYDKIAEPERKTKYSAGYDFVTPITISLRPNEKIVVPLGYKVKCEATGIYFALFLRSSIASNYGIMMMNSFPKELVFVKAFSTTISLLIMIMVVLLSVLVEWVLLVNDIEIYNFILKEFFKNGRNQNYY